MKKLRNIAFVTGMVFVSTVVLFAGGGGQAATPSGPVTIDFWYCFGGNAQKATLELVDRFNEANKGSITVEPSYNGDYITTTAKLLAAIVAGDTPVAVHNNPNFLPQFTDHYEGLNRYFARDNSVNESDYVKTFLEVNRINGEVFGLPFSHSTIVMYYNKDLFRTAGLDPDKPPVTWDDVYEYSKKIHALGPDFYGVNWGTGTLGWLTRTIIWTFGGKWVADDNSTLLWTEPASLEAMNFMKKMVDEEVAAYRSQGSDAFNFSGKVGIWFGSTASIGDTIAATNFDVGVAFFPYKVNRQISGGGASLYMMKNSPQAKKDAAWKLITFLTNDESQMLLSKESGYMVMSTKALNSQEMRDWWIRDPRYRVTYEQLDYQVYENNTYMIPLEEVRLFLHNAWGNIFLNNADVATEVRDAQEKGNRVLAEYHKR